MIEGWSSVFYYFICFYYLISLRWDKYHWSTMKDRQGACRKFSFLENSYFIQTDVSRSFFFQIWMWLKDEANVSCTHHEFFSSNQIFHKSNSEPNNFRWQPCHWWSSAHGWLVLIPSSVKPFSLPRLRISSRPFFKQIKTKQIIWLRQESRKTATFYGIVLLTLQ